MLRTNNINVTVTRPPTNIPLGRQGDNLATCIIFDCSGLVQLYGDGTAELLHELKSGTVYPVAIKQDGTSVSWIVTASDTATVGAGRAELRWYVGDTLAKSAKFRTSVSSALADSTTETPPEPQKSWVDKVLAAAQEIKDGVISDEKLAEAIAAYLEEHKIDAGLDEAALAAYLTENGYLTDAALAGAVAQALADAKASGQFDGAPGKDGEAGAPGADGADGVGIESVVQTTTSTEDGGTNIVTVTKTDGSTSTFEVRNGSKGNDGAPGAAGTDGAAGQPGTSGKSAYQYAVEGGYTGTEDEFKTKMAEEMPDTLPNPNPLTFTGAVTGSYDGSEPLTVDIPSGEGGVVAETWDFLINAVIAEDCTEAIFNSGDAGETLSDYKELLLLIDLFGNKGGYTTSIKAGFLNTVTVWISPYSLSMNGYAADTTQYYINMFRFKKTEFGILPVNRYTQYNKGSMSQYLSHTAGTSATDFTLPISANAHVTTDMVDFTTQKEFECFRIGGYQAVIGAGTIIKVWGKR